MQWKGSLDYFLNFITEYYRVKYSKQNFTESILLLISLILLLGERLMRMGNFWETIFWSLGFEELKFVRILREWGLWRPHWKALADSFLARVWGIERAQVLPVAQWLSKCYSIRHSEIFEAKRSFSRSLRTTTFFNYIFKSCLYILDSMKLGLKVWIF